jgi:vibriolysin
VAWLGASLAGCGAVEQGDGVLEGAPKDADVRSALSQLEGVEVVDIDGDVPSYIRGPLGKVSSTVSDGMTRREATVSAEVRSALERVAPVFRLSAGELVFKRASTDGRGHQFLRFQQVRQGLEVVGGELLLHVDVGGNVYAANGSARGGSGVAAQTRVAPETAVRAALRGSSALQPTAEGPARLVYLHAEGQLRLAYEVRVVGARADGLPVDDLVYVHAVDGRTLDTHPRIHTAQNRAVYSANNGSLLPGSLKRGETGAATGDSHVDMNHGHLGTTYQCYFQNFGRDSFDAAGAQLKSSVHYGSNYVNAYWNGVQMVYGDADGVQSDPLGKSLDVTVHELTHAVTDSESDLVYSNESGALNEAMSDIFSAYCEAWTKSWATDAAVWMIGDDVWTPATAGDALRYMANPTQDGSSKDYYPERYTGTQDNGGVHWNSGIANLAFYLLSQGGTHPRGKTTTVVTGIGVRKAGKIFYEANANCLTASSNFAAAKTCTEQKAEQFYGAAEKAAVTAAWEAVGVGGTSTPPPSCSAPVALSNGVAVTHVVAEAGTWSCTYTLSVPSGQSSLKFELSGGTGDGDMYVRAGAEPNTTTYDCRPYQSGNTETCSFTHPASGTWYVKVYGYSASSGASLKGSYSASSGGGNVLTNGVETAVYSGAASSWTCFTLNVPAGRSKVTFNQLGKTGATGDADLFVRYNAPPTTTSYNCRPYLSGNTESCSITNPAAGTWYACSRGYSAFSNVAMKGTY